MLSGAPFYTPWIGLEGIKREGPGPSEGLKIRGGPVVLGGDNVAPLVEIGLTDLPKTGGAKAPPASSLRQAWDIFYLHQILLLLSNKNIFVSVTEEPFQCTYYIS